MTSPDSPPPAGDPSAEGRRALVTRAAGSVAWLMLGRWVQILVALATLAIMARFLGPEIYGAYSLAILAMTFTDTLVFNTFSDALVQRRTYDARHVSAAFLISLGLSLAVALLLIPTAAPIAAAMDAPAMAEVLPIIGIATVLMGAGVVPAALLQRDLRQRELVLIEQAAILVSSLGGIALAIGGAGIWALVGAELLRAAIRTTGLVRASGWRPSLTTDAEALAEVFHYGRTIVGIKAMLFADRMIPRVVIGLVLGPAAVGHFTLGWRLYDQIQRMIVTPMTSIAMATVARVQDDMGFLRRLLTGAARTSSLVAYPAFAGAAAIAPTAIPFVFGSQWQDAVLPAQLLALIGMRAAVTGFNGGLMRGLGRQDLQLRLSAITLLFTALVVPAVVQFGVAAVAAALLLRSFVTWPVSALFVRRLIGLPVSVQARTAGKAFLSALVMAAVVLALQQLLAHWRPVVLLPLLLAAGAVSYGVMLALVAPDFARATVGAAAALLRRDRAAARRLLMEAGSIQANRG